MQAAFSNASYDQYYGDSDTSSEGGTCYSEGEFGWTDTDDEVEEANAADDMIKIIEGDWR
jgi:hypothetical protein